MGTRGKIFGFSSKKKILEYQELKLALNLKKKKTSYYAMDAYHILSDRFQKINLFVFIQGRSKSCF